ncbi:MAG TPA: helix-turn-helix transcriptional regulator [Bacilli bacterium]
MGNPMYVDKLLEQRIDELDLTPREKEIATYWALDYDYRQIGKALHISENTVRTVIGKINLKMHVNSKASFLLKIFGVI